MRFTQALILTILTAALVTCGSRLQVGSGSGNNNDSGSSDGSGYQIGGNISGLGDGELSLVLNGSETVTAGDGGYGFVTTLDTGEEYSVAIESIDGGSYQCSLVNNTGTVQEADVLDVDVVCNQVTLQAYFPNNGADWLDYIDSDGTSNPDPSTLNDTACADSNPNPGRDTCINGGAWRRLAIETEADASCADYVAEDKLGLFTWDCLEQSSNQLEFYSSDASKNASLRNMIECVNNNCNFKANSVTISKNGSIEVQTEESENWWGNPIEVVNISGSSVSLNSPGTIYVLTEDDSAHIQFDANRVAFVTMDGVTLSGNIAASDYVISADSRKYGWIEANIDAAGFDLGVFINISDHFYIGDTTVTGASLGSGSHKKGFYFSNASYLTINRIRAQSNDGGGVHFNASDLSDISFIDAISNPSGGGIIIDGGGLFRFKHLNATSNGGVGISINSVINSTFASLSMAANISDGLYIVGTAADNEFSEVSSVGNFGDGIEIFSVTSFNSIEGLTLRSNNQSGLYLNTSQGILVAGGSISENNGHNIYLNNSQFNVLASLGTHKTSSSALRVESASHDNLFYMITAATSGDGIMNQDSHRNKYALVTSVHNQFDGIIIMDSQDTFMTGVTTAMNNRHGIYFFGGQNSLITSLVSVVNNGDGIRFETATANATANRFHNVISAHNSTSTIMIPTGETGSDGHNWSGIFDGDDRCYNDGGVASPGYTPVACDPVGTANYTTINSGDLDTSFRGRVSSDSTNGTNHSDGTALSSNISDWSQFDSALRAWGNYGGGASFSSIANAGDCSGNCQIWDWRPAKNDSQIRNRLNAPDTSASNNLNHGFISGLTTIFPDAFEVVGDGIGDEDFLCEGGEECVIQATLGGYVGTDDLEYYATVNGFSGGDIVLYYYSSF